ncbi:uncharacterized protein SAPINGB_P005337 [Magnusiomyces paraingens]|uniref:F-box domain-containing protein n=1 Tax=Magnusiomyces paraingens TaxID=2606893 RepID=A0A5E8C1K7_9ASCO|nr:uncharacterized protein SAPINGB_P005337 [Saprochaete ingens]VVT56850.1 unnamed protein product [Saprochaete ingens]
MIWTLENIPDDLHFELSEFLLEQDLQILTQTSQKLRHIYWSKKWNKVSVFQSKKDMHNSLYTKVTLNVMLHPEKYSWFANDLVGVLRININSFIKIIPILPPIFDTPEFFKTQYPKLRAIQFIDERDTIYLESYLKKKQGFSPFLFFHGNMVIVHALIKSLFHNIGVIYMDSKFVRKVHLELKNGPFQQLPEMLSKLPFLNFLRIEVPFMFGNNSMPKSFPVLMKRFPSTLETFLLRFYPIYPDDDDQLNFQTLDELSPISSKLIIPDVTAINYRFYDAKKSNIFNYFIFPKLTHLEVEGDSSYFNKLEPLLFDKITILRLSFYGFINTDDLYAASVSLKKLQHLQRLGLNYFTGNFDRCIPDFCAVLTCLEVLRCTPGNRKTMVTKSARAIEKLLKMDVITGYQPVSHIYTFRKEIAGAIFDVVTDPFKEHYFDSLNDPILDIIDLVWRVEGLFKVIQSLTNIPYLYVESSEYSPLPFSPSLLKILTCPGTIKQMLFTQVALEKPSLHPVVFLDEKDDICEAKFEYLYGKSLKLPYTVFSLIDGPKYRLEEKVQQYLFDLEQKRDFVDIKKQFTTDYDISFTDNWGREFGTQGQDFHGWV